jgi:imidazolonepropionase-like amidohydrolase
VIEPGRYGDIIAVRGDPLANVAVLEHVDAVIKGGQLVKGPGQAQ